MPEVLKIARSFTGYYGMMLLGTVEYEMDAGHPNLTEENVPPLLDAAIEDVLEQAGEDGDTPIIRPMMDLLRAMTDEDVRALGLPNASSRADVTFSGMGTGGLLPSEWDLIIEYSWQKMFGPADPATPEEKAKIKSEVTITDTETLDQFRARMKAEGRLDK